MSDMLHCQRQLQALLRTEVSGIQAHSAANTWEDLGRHQPCIEDCVKIQCCYQAWAWFGFVFNKK